LNGTKLDDDGIAWPCGLVAKSVFNDNYTLYTSTNSKVAIDETGIAWESDKEYKFKNGPTTSSGDYTTY